MTNVCTDCEVPRISNLCARRYWFSIFDELVAGALMLSN